MPTADMIEVPQQVSEESVPEYTEVLPRTKPLTGDCNKKICSTKIMVSNLTYKVIN